MWLEDYAEAVRDAYNYWDYPYRFDWYELRDKLITDPILVEIRDNLRGIYYIFENLFAMPFAFPLKPFWVRYLENQVQDAGALTMADIINTMLLADPDEVMYFVGIVDAYRQSVWNRPFNKEFFAGLARGFAIWP